VSEVWSDGKSGASAIPHDLHLGAYDAKLTGISVHGRRLVQDTRDLEPGDIFVALGRPDAPALPFVHDAFARGAAAVLVDAAAVGDEIMPVDVYRVSRLASVLGAMADDFTGHPSSLLSVVGITGTNGKTSTSFLLTQAWAALDVRSATIGTLGAGITGEPRINMGMTTPQVTTLHQYLADFVARGVERVAMEVSSHALHQERVAGVRFDTVAFTNLTRDHLDYHGTMEEYARQKAKIFGLPGVTTAVVNVDDEFGYEHFGKLRPGIRRIGVSSRGHASAVVHGERVRLTTQGIEFDLVIEGSRHPVSSSLIGRFNVDNLLACAAVLWSQGVPVDRVAALLGPLQPVFGRMTRIQPSAALPLVVVDAGHTPDAVRQAVTALRESGHRRIITVFGATGDRDPGKRPEMARIVEEGSDLIVVTDDDVHDEDGDAILADIRAGFANPAAVVEIRDRTTAIAYAIDAAGPDDVVLLQGKGHEPYQIVANGERVPFSDVDTAERLLRERLGPSDGEAGR
jgi:UDP-N-acetylmuramoyl-L-alanyl-D-glutamate--2,6-diaminopimelate ligase